VRGGGEWVQTLTDFSSVLETRLSPILYQSFWERAKAVSRSEKAIHTVNMEKRKMRESAEVTNNGHY
jgi:hypothetical protein